MKAYLYDVFHRCDSKDDWNPSSCSLSLSSTQKVEGRYSIKMTSNAGVTCAMYYDRNLDWSEFKNLVFWVYHPGWTNEKGDIIIYSTGIDWKSWEFDFAASWTEITIDLSSVPDNSLGTLDLSSIFRILIRENSSEDPGEDYYIDFIHGKTIDITDDITYCKVVEELGMPSFAELKIKGESLDHFNAGLTIDIYDKDDVLSWTGRILYPESVLEGTKVVGKLKALGSNSQFNNAYRKNYTTARSSDYILKDVIDNALPKFSYDDEIDDFSALTFKYDMKTKIQKLFNYLMMLERAVIHYRPDGEIFFNKYDNLSKGPQIYQGTHNFDEEAVGTSGTDIAFVDIVSGTPTTCEIIASLAGHKKVLKLIADGADEGYSHDLTQSATGINEFYIYISTDVLNKLRLYEGATNLTYIYGDPGGVWKTYNGAGWDNSTINCVINTWYHVKIQWYADNTFDWYINSELAAADVAMLAAQVSGVNKASFQINIGTFYLDAYGDEDDANYDVGDNLKCWDESTKNIKITSYTPNANRHITRTPVIGASNDLGQVYYVGKASDTLVQKYGINQLQPWRDSEITNYSEAKQLGDNLLAIYSIDTQMISILAVGKGHLQVGKTLNMGWAGTFSITQADFLLTKRVWYPITDINELELTDNILTRKAFNIRIINKFQDEDAQQSYEEPDVPESTVDGTVLALHSVAELRAMDFTGFMIGSANSEYKVCAFNEHGKTTRAVRNFGGYITNVTTGSIIIYFVLDLPTNRGEKKLYIDGMKLAVLDADDNNFVDIINLYGFTYAGGLAVIDTNGTDYKTPQEVVDGYGTVYDVSGYDYVGVKVSMFTANASACDIGNPLLDCYYDT